MSADIVRFPGLPELRDYRSHSPSPSDVARFVEVGLSRFRRAGDDDLEQLVAAEFVLKNALYLYAALVDGQCAISTAHAAFDSWEAVYPSDGVRTA